MYLHISFIHFFLNRPCHTLFNSKLTNEKIAIYDITIMDDGLYRKNVYKCQFVYDIFFPVTKIFKNEQTNETYTDKWFVILLYISDAAFDFFFCSIQMSECNEMKKIRHILIDFVFSVTFFPFLPSFFIWYFYNCPWYVKSVLINEMK